jgi:hypothetical protein
MATSYEGVALRVPGPTSKCKPPATAPVTDRGAPEAADDAIAVAVEPGSGPGNVLPALARLLIQLAAADPAPTTDEAHKRAQPGSRPGCAASKIPNEETVREHCNSTSRRPRRGAPR